MIDAPRVFRQLAVLTAVLGISVLALSAQTDPRYPPVPPGYIPQGVPAFTYVDRLPVLTSLAFLHSDKSASVDQIRDRLVNGDFRIFVPDSLDSFGYSSGAMWFAFVLENRQNHFSTTFLEVRDRNLNRVELLVFRLKDSGKTAHSKHLSGQEVPFSAKEIRVGKTVFPLSLEPATKALVLCRVTDNGPSNIHLLLHNNATLMTESTRSDFLFQIMGGGILMLLLFSILVLVTLKDRLYWWFFGHAVCSGLFILSVNGYGTLFLFPEFPWIETTVSWPLLVIGCSMLIQLFRRIAAPSGESPLPRLDRFARVSAIALPIIGLAPIFWGNTVLPALAVTIPCMAVSGFLLAPKFRAGDPDARIGLSVLAVQVAGALVSLASPWIGVHGEILFWTTSAYQIGLFASELLLALLLAESIDKLKTKQSAAEERDRIKEILIANVSHEMRTPLNGILGFTEEILALEANPQAIRAGTRIKSEAKRLQRQVDLMLDMTRLESGQIQSHQLAFDLDPLFDELLTNHAESAMTKGLELVGPTPSGDGVRVSCDRQRLLRVLDELVDNAIKFTSKGSVHIGYCLSEPKSGRTELQITIEDTGIGIPPGMMPEIGRSFFQADPLSTHRFGGIGLGSHLAWRLAALLQGTIDFSSVLGKGSRFRFSLPVLVDAANPPVALNSRTKPAAAGPYRILAVDDLETNRQVICILLRNFDLEIVCAESGEAALDLLGKESFDLVTMDIYMPGMGGIAATRAIRAMPGLAPLPVIGITASDSETDRSACRESGMDDVLIKPLSRPELLKCLSRFIPMVPKTGKT